MNNIFDIFKGLFVRNFGTGALKSPQDPRNIPLSAVQAPAVVPEEWITDMSIVTVEDQGPQPSCVGYAIGKGLEYYYAKNGKPLKLSKRALYALSKKQDGIPDIRGTYPTTAASVAVNMGVPTTATVPDNTSLSYSEYVDVLPFQSDQKFLGYAFVSASFEAIKQAIFQNKWITASFSVDYGWFNGVLSKVLSAIGRHYVLLHGYSSLRGTLIGQNSWGTTWIGKVAGLFNPQVNPGHFEVSWADVSGDIVDILAFVEIPFSIKEDYLKNWTMKYFTPQEVVGLQTPFAEKLDKARGFAGIPFAITSGYRTASHNAEVGGVSDSSHTLGIAADIRARDKREKFLIVKGAIAADIPRIIVYPYHVHLDDDRSKSYPMLDFKF